MFVLDLVVTKSSKKGQEANKYRDCTEIRLGSRGISDASSAIYCAVTQ